MMDTKRRVFLIGLLLIMPLLMGSLLFFGDTDPGGGGGPPIDPNPGKFTDDFNRSPNSDISIGAPDPPGSWTEYSFDVDNCPSEISSNRLLMRAGISGCANSITYAYANEDLSSPDQAAFVVLSDTTNWESGRGPRLILRASSDPVSGFHYEFRCNSPTCNAGRVEYVNGFGQFQNAITLDGDCDLPDSMSGDAISFSVEDSGSNTIFKVWQHDSFQIPTINTEDANTWGVADCTLNSSTPFQATPILDTGNFVGVGVGHSGTLIVGSEYQFDDFSGTNLIQLPLNPGTMRSNGQPVGTIQSGISSTVMSLDTDDPATCKYDTSQGVDYALMSNTFGTTGPPLTTHQETLIGLLDGGDYQYYVRCDDGVNVNPDDFPIEFSVDFPMTLTGLSASPLDSSVFIQWTPDPNQLDHFEYEIRYKEVVDPTWTNEPSTQSTSATISTLINGTDYDVEVRSCDVDGDATPPLCSAWDSATFTPATPSASPNVEARCTELGAGCIGSEPMNTNSITCPTTDYGGTNDADFGDSEGVGSKEFDRPLDGCGSIPTATSVSDVDLPTGQSSISFVQRWNPAGSVLDSRIFPSSDPADRGYIPSTARRYCQRVYKKFSPNFAYSGVVPCLANKQQEFWLSGFGGRTTAQLSDNPTLDGSILLNVLSGGGCDWSNGGKKLFGSGDQVGVQECTDNWCRLETCVSSDVDIKLAQNVTFSGYIEQVGVPNPKREDYLPYTAGTNTCGSFFEFWPMSGYRECNGDGSVLGYQYVTHAMAAQWSTDAGQWIGAAPEVEGVPPAPDSAEQRCGSLGSSNCVCSEMLDSSETLVNNGDSIDSSDVYECWGNRSGASSFNTNATHTTTDVSADPDWGSAEYAVDWTSGFVWLNPPDVTGSLGIDANTRTYCMRYYEQVDNPYSSAGQSEDALNGQCETNGCTIEGSVYNCRNKQFEATFTGGLFQAAEYAGGDCQPPGSHNAFFFKEEGFAGGSNQFVGGGIRYDDCDEAPCRFEFCIDGNLQAGTNIQARYRITSLEPGGIEGLKVGTAGLTTGAPTSPNEWGGNKFHSGPLGDSKFSHYMVAKWDTDNDDWIGPAVEIEGCTPDVDCYADRVQGGDLDDPLLLTVLDFEHPDFYVPDDAPFSQSMIDEGASTTNRGSNSRWTLRYGNGTPSAIMCPGCPQGTPYIGIQCNEPTGCTGPREYCSAAQGATGGLGYNCWGSATRDMTESACFDFQRFENADYAAELPSITGPSAALDNGRTMMALRNKSGASCGFVYGAGSDISWSPAETTVGITMAFSFSKTTDPDDPSYAGILAAPWKMDEWDNPDPQYNDFNQFPLGGTGSCNGGSGNWPYCPFLLTDNDTCAEFGTPTNTIGGHSCIYYDRGTPGPDPEDNSAIQFSPASYSRSTDLLYEDWNCAQGFIEGLGTANARVRVWHNGTAIIDVSNINDLNSMGGLTSYRLNAYANTNESGGAQTTNTSFRYEDNIHIRSGFPVSCSQIGFDYDGALP